MPTVPDRRLLLTRFGVVGASVALLAGLATSAAPVALAAPATPTFGPAIDDPADYEGQGICDPTEKPGVQRFRAMVSQAYSGVNTGGIVRACGVGGRSEHKEGRAWDWMLRADVATDRAKADDLLGWLLETDARGNEYARARRMGVMYVIWDRQWWSAWDADAGWKPYTGASPHTDHIHFTFSWDGALERTSWWNDGVPSTGPTPTDPTTEPEPDAGTDPGTDPEPDADPDAEPIVRDPFGDLEQASATTSSSDGAPAIRAVGWAIDPDASTFTRVRLELDGAAALTVVADRNRPDVAAENPPYKANHGFDAVVPASAGEHELCATAVNQSTGSDVDLGCLDVTVPAASSPSGSSATPEPAPAPATSPPPRQTDDSCPTGRVPSAGFTDTVGSVHAAAVDCAVWWKVARGTGAGRFSPDGSLDRAQIATFLARTLSEAGLVLPASPPDAFDDDEGSVHELAINQMAALGVVKGKGEATYAPGDTVTRAQMASYLVRTFEHRTGRLLPAGSDWFADDDANVHEPAIEKAARAGFTAGSGAGAFSPDASTGRGQVASFLTRVLDLMVESGWAPDRSS